MDYYIVDAFTDVCFHGNPAGVCLLERPISQQLMQQIAFENHLPETAFVLKKEEAYTLKWFTPLNEIDLCGHATLAAAYVIFHFVDTEIRQVAFETASGILSVNRKGALYEMSFPIKNPRRITDVRHLEEILHLEIQEAYYDRDLFLVLDSQERVAGYVPRYEELAFLDDWLGIVITAEGREVDFVSRYFCPELKEEDPVTGSSHCSLVPIWNQKLKKNKFIARQLSQSGGTLYCALDQDCVRIAGHAKLYLKGEIMCPAFDEI